MRKTVSIYRRKGSINTEDESDLFEGSDIPEPPKPPTGPAKKGRKRKHEQVEIHEEAEGEDNDDDYKILVEANIYNILGEYEQGLEGMRINFGNNKCYSREKCPELQNQVWIKGEWVLSGSSQRFKMEYQKQKEFSEEIHGRMIATVRDIIKKRDEEASNPSIENKPNEESTSIAPADPAYDPSLEKVFFITSKSSKSSNSPSISETSFYNGVYEGFYEHNGKRNKEKFVLCHTLNLSMTATHIKKSIETVGYGENNMGFFIIEGSTQFPKDNRSKMVYFQGFNQQESDDDEYQEKGEDRDLEQMDKYLVKKRILAKKIGKMKLVRSYVEKPEIKKRRKREKKESKDEEEKCNNIKIPILPENQTEIKPEIDQALIIEEDQQKTSVEFQAMNQQREQNYMNQNMPNNIMFNKMDYIGNQNIMQFQGYAQQNTNRLQSMIPEVGAQLSNNFMNLGLNYSRQGIPPTQNYNNHNFQNSQNQQFYQGFNQENNQDNKQGNYNGHNL